MKKNIVFLLFQINFLISFSQKNIAVDSTMNWFASKLNYSYTYKSDGTMRQVKQTANFNSLNQSLVLIMSTNRDIDTLKIPLNILNPCKVEKYNENEYCKELAGKCPVCLSIETSNNKLRMITCRAGSKKISESTSKCIEVFTNDLEIGERLKKALVYAIKEMGGQCQSH